MPARPLGVLFAADPLPLRQTRREDLVRPARVSEASVENLPRIIELLLELYREVGPGQLWAFIIVTLGAAGAFLWWQDRRLRRPYELLGEEKERTIQRIAEENKTYRNYCFFERGLTLDQIKQLVDPHMPTKPLTLAPPRPKKKKK